MSTEALRLGFTGTQQGMTDEQRFYVAHYLKSLVVGGAVEVHHGACIGADTDFDLLAREHKLRRVGHPPLLAVKQGVYDFDEQREPKGYLTRDIEIVDECDVLLATPSAFEEQLRSGTWFTIRQARRQNKPVRIVFPDGSSKEDGYAVTHRPAD